MEYNLLKTIEGNFSKTLVSSTYPQLTPYPATDFVNPGLGQISRLYSFYVPLYSHKDLFSVTKKVNNLEGSGEVTNSEIIPESTNKAEVLSEELQSKLIS